MKKIAFALLTLVIPVLFISCGSSSDSSDTFVFYFTTGSEGWISGFADLPVDYEQDKYMLGSDWRALPAPLTGNGLYIQGINRSDDLFMFYKKRIAGLSPSTVYSLKFDLEIATNAPEGLIGVGGSPGESVFVKAGASTIEPLAVAAQDKYYRMNIDKGNQSSEGEDMIVIGDLASPDVNQDNPWALKKLSSSGKEFTAVTNETGELWLIVGTDSGFESLTALYYSTISVSFS